LEAEARIAVLLADTVQALRIDSVLAEQGDRPVRFAGDQGSKNLIRAHIAAGLGRREQAVALLRDVAARYMFEFGHSHEYHTDLLLAPLRGYPPFDALLKPEN
jgi:hypothetical protein